MEENSNKTFCPVCEKQITENENVKICPSCGTTYHQTCWENNNGCVFPDCSEHNSKTPENNYCPPLTNQQLNFCPNCGTKIENGQLFCPKCGQKLTTEPSFEQNSKTKTDTTPPLNKKKKKKLAIIIGVAVGIIILTVTLIVVFSQNNKKNFKEMFSEYEAYSWCIFGEDGSYMRLDTNPDDIDSDDFTYSYYQFILDPANTAIAAVNKKLGFSDALKRRMDETTWSQGLRTESNGRYKVSWTYHPNKGLEVIYEIKD